MRKVILSLALLAIGYMNLDQVKSIETVIEIKSKLRTETGKWFCNRKNRGMCESGCESRGLDYVRCRVSQGTVTCTCKGSDS